MRALLALISALLIAAPAFAQQTGPSGGGASGANPTATMATAAVNGTATTFLRSDGAPALGTATPALANLWTFNAGILIPDGQALFSDGTNSQIAFRTNPSGNAGHIQFNRNVGAGDNVTGYDSNITNSSGLVSENVYANVINQTSTGATAFNNCAPVQTALGSGRQDCTAVYTSGGTFVGGALRLDGAMSELAPFAEGATPTLTGSCTTGSKLGGATAGSFALTALCTAGTVILSMPTLAHPAPTGWACFASDRTTPADLFVETASSASSVTLTGTGASADVIQFACTAYK